MFYKMTEPVKTGEGETKVSNPPVEGSTPPQAPAKEPEKPQSQPEGEKKEEGKVVLTKAEHEELQRQAELGSKSEHLYNKNRLLKQALHTDKPDVAKAIDDKEAREIKETVDDLILSNPQYAQLVAETPELRAILRTNPLSLVPAGEVIYDLDDVREVIGGILDKRISKSNSSAPQTPAPKSDNQNPAPAPATPPSSAAPVEPKDDKAKQMSQSQQQRQPMQRIQDTIANKLRGGK